MDTRTALTACPLDCPDTCSVMVTLTRTSGGTERVTRVDAAPPELAANVLTQGFICAKVKRFGEHVHGTRRVLHPLVRSGPKGSGQFRRATWDEAVALVAQRLQEAAASPDGPASVVPYLYGSSSGVLASGGGLGMRLWDWFGAAWVEHTICAATYGEAWDAVYGGMRSAHPSHVPSARTVVLWGANPTVSHTHLLPLLAEARANGAQVAVVDPRRTGVAGSARWHLPVRPGTDAAVALAMARHAAHHDLLDRAFCDAHVDGVEAFLAVADRWTLERAADVAGVEAAAIAEVVEAWATSRPALLRVGYGIERNRNGGASLRSVLALPALLGTFGVEGGGVLGSLSDGRPVHVRRVPPPWDAGRPPRRVVNQNRLGAVLCGEDPGAPVRVLFVQGANPAAMNPAQHKVLRGLAREDLFTVVHEQAMTDTALMADVVLPATTHLESLDVAGSYGSATLQELPAVMAPVGESRTTDEVAAALAAALGWPAASFTADPEALLREVLDGGPRTREWDAPQVQFRTTFPARGRIVLAGPHEPVAAADDPRFPFVLVTPANGRTVNSMLAPVRPPDPVVHVHPTDAMAVGVRDGDRVLVGNDAGDVALRVRIDPAVRPGVVSVAKGMWREHVGGGLTVNALCPDEVEPTAGGACFNDARVRIRPAADTGAGPD